MATIKPKPFLRNLEDKPFVAVKLAEIGNLLRPLGLGTPLPATMNFSNEILPIYLMTETAGNAITKQHLRTITDSFTAITHPNIHSAENLHKPIKAEDINFKELTPADIDRFLTLVTNMLEQASVIDIYSKTPRYTGGSFLPDGADRLAFAWNESVRQPRDKDQEIKPRIVHAFDSSQIEKLCKLIAECHVIAGTKSISPVIQYHIAQLPERADTFLIEQDKPVTLLAAPAPDITGPFVQAVEELPVQRQQASEIPSFAPGAPEILAYKG